MYIVNDKKDYLVKTTVELGELYGCERPQDITITLKEPGGLDFIELQEGIDPESPNYQAMTKKVIELLPSVIVSHNLHKDADTPLTNAEVVNFIVERAETMTRVINQYTQEVLFLSAKRKQGDESEI
ncbi:hypothetical protein [Spirochaeta africana]|uniref:Uncharacterized protein n=1 Tax=Spirochaeta africana (strain ATCC 700263 / DSM 8902 / Z-7692) TaxID=889378 RepID=H9UJD6_SPIAZ|nr:hypothetical protein [Spirochaeta africana]AFG37629.1 hypothetical protein Spiaf_1570 [Spirochaeta africana DSM 8902]